MTLDRTLRIDAVFQPTDFTLASETAFAHALRIAVAARTSLSLLHVDPKADAAPHWNDFPAVRATLERWGMLPAGSPKEAVLELGLDVEKIVARGRDTQGLIVRNLAAHVAPLLVLATHRRDGSWLRRSLAERVARRSRAITLFVPRDARGFVSEKDGSVSLGTVLVPIAPDHRPRFAVEVATRLARTLDSDHTVFRLVYVGDPSDMPTFELPAHPSFEFKRETRKGPVLDQLQAAVREDEPDLVVMATDSRHGMGHALRGSTTERLMRGATCPVLALG